MAGSQGTEYSYIGKGSLYIIEKGAAGAMRPVGNVSALSLKATEEKKELQDSQNAGGGQANSLRRITAVEMSMAMRDFVAENIAMAVFGSASAQVAGSVAAEELTLYAGGLIPLEMVGPSNVVVTSVDGDAAAARANSTAYSLGDFYVPAVANGHYYKVTVAGTSAGAPPTFPTNGSTVADGTATVKDMGLIVYPTDGTYYEVLDGGLYIPSTAAYGDISASVGVAVTVAYDHLAHNIVQALVNAGKDWTMRFIGLNEAQSGKPVVVDVHRGRFGPLQEFGLIGDDYASMELNGDVLKDTSITTAGLSQYFVFRYV